MEVIELSQEFMDEFHKEHPEFKDMDMNNWFEVINQDGDCIGDTCESYDDAIEWLKEVSDGKY